MRSSGDDADDAEAVKRCRAGDASGFEPIVLRYQRVLFNVAYRMVHDREDARDLAQGALVKAFERLSTYDGRHRFFSWIYRILVNDTLNHLDRRRPTQELDANARSTSPSPVEQIQDREEGERVQRALMLLPVDSREVLVLRHFADLSYTEMSEALDIPEKTVKSRLYTARQRISELLEGSATA